MQQPDGQESSIDKEDIHHGSSNLLEASSTTYEASMLYEVQGNSSKQDNAAKDLGNLTVTSFAGGCVGENSIIEDVKDASDVTGMHAENLNDEDHDSSSLLSGSMQIYCETNPSMQTDPLKCDQNLSASQRRDEKSHLNDMGCDDNEKVVGSSVPGEGVKGNVDLESKTPVGEYPVLNALEEDTNLASKVGDCNEELESPFNDAVLVHKDENEETELEVLEEPRASILGQSSEMADELAIVSEPQKPGCKTDNQSISGMQTAD
ncbi:uncharacterized protein LOC111387052, partial [Olea europaea var. sylvestris]